MNFESAGATWVDSWGFGDQATVRSTRAAKVKLKYKYKDKVKYNDKHKEELRLRLCFNRSSPSLPVPVDGDPVLEFLRQILNKNNSFISHSYNYNMQEDHTYDDLHEDLSLSCLTFEFCWQRPLCASPHHSSISSSSPGLASSSSSFNLNQLASYHSGSFFKIKFFSCIPLFRQGSTGRLFSFGSLEEEEEE